ncbi:hypothetical protein PIB30_005604 [Stylosanthes scabra]|uniref:Uncharacterized protein n=1 Tax=Stylosanthes scabra TaxID=79078 RepID=A0ABU6S465_9FABA|nr:hypothetical protein [Stylosanthes scabra]
MEIEKLCQARNVDKPNNNRNSNRSNRHKNSIKEEIIKEILNSKLIKPPTNVGAYNDQKNADKSKYCTFHQKHGHNTEGCDRDTLTNILMDTSPKTLKEAHLIQTKIKRKRFYRTMLNVEGVDFNPQTQQKEIPQITFEQSDLKTATKNLDKPNFDG